MSQPDRPQDSQASAASSSYLRSFAFSLVEGGWLPDAVISPGINQLLTERLHEQQPTGALKERYKQQFISGLKKMPLAIKMRDANEQHYEVPTEFFLLSLGPHLKYSCCYYGFGDGDATQQRSGLPSIKTLGDAEVAMFRLYVERGKLKDGQVILDLGCGWGSLSLWLAKEFPKSKITAVSNSRTQKEFIEGRCREGNLTNLTVITSDINQLQLPTRQFDRIVSIEMLEHCKNYEKVFALLGDSLKDNGLAFVHVFAHIDFPYHFEYRSQDDWMTKEFFEGGTMPSHDLFLFFQDDLRVVDRWLVDGRNYGKTSLDWLALVDANWAKILSIFSTTYGAANAQKWAIRWRLFYLACANCFNYADGQQWVVSHFLFEKRNKLPSHE